MVANPRQQMALINVKYLIFIILLSCSCKSEKSNNKKKIECMNFIQDNDWEKDSVGCLRLRWGGINELF
jgi:hypothetical protein